MSRFKADPANQGKIARTGSTSGGCRHTNTDGRGGRVTPAVRGNSGPDQAGTFGPVGTFRLLRGWSRIMPLSG
jgi:hypothetical protein